ncbi:protein ALTERED PHOSPHATE STARVATION RESPONSE 1 [Mercurialis annua]|uniref:protein ALTERED PHOSPHATE STARVATION RESPONSE 1 n=1 Tax=Mercurialis annua TaxID=3986 RepID=UPI00215EF370|nr:protein ALTERED PHOSPHATE STARVATION RESPONSE 1 [Mercurialis annua]
MGCASSKVDDLPAVALCRERCSFLDEAINQRFLLADAHRVYIECLKTVGNSLHVFIQQDYGGGGSGLNLPFTHKKVDPVIDEGRGSSPKKNRHSHSNSGSGSHLHFHSDSEEDDDDDSVSHIHHSDHSSPLHDMGGGGGHMQYMGSEYMGMQDMYSGGGGGAGGGGGGGGYLHMNYMKNKATSSVVYEQRPMTPETVRFGEYYNNNSNNNPYQANYFGYPNYYGDGGGGGGGGGGGYYGSQPPPYGSMQPAAAVASSSKRPPPPPPPPPSSSPWDFLNLFESNESYYPAYTPSRDSKELREEEGIPDLEEENYQHEVVKEVHGHEKYVDGGGGGGGGPSGGVYSSKSVMMDDGDAKGGGGSNSVEASLYQTRPSVSMENEGLEYEVHVVEKKVVDNERSDEHKNAGFKRGGGLRDVSQVAFEIKIQFERASESGQEIALMLEVGRLPYHRKHVSKMLQGVTPSLSLISSQPSTSKSTEASSSADKADQFAIDEDLLIRSKNLSSTLQKLHLWEKKLYSEVKTEEKMRVDHERKLRKLKHLDERGAEAHKVDATRISIRDLSTKIKIAIQVVDKISITINKIRDEELWPQLNLLIQGLTRMWKSMLECHQYQCQAIKEAKGLGSIGLSKNSGDEHLTATLKLEHDLLCWTSSFSSWIGTQKGYVRALNNWLSKCLLYEPEETPDGIAPFSPGRIGAPPVFVICNQWAQAMDAISEKEVIDAMRSFASNVLKLWEQDILEMRQRMTANKDLERKVKTLDRQDQRIHKEIQALDKKIVLVAGDAYSLSVAGNIVYQSDTSNSSLQGSLQRIFESMEKFMSELTKAYEELIQRTEEERLAREHDRVS